MPTTSANQSTAMSPRQRLMPSASEAVNPAPVQVLAGKPSDGIVTIGPGGITSGTAFFTCLDCGAHFCRSFSDPNPQPHVCGVLEHCNADAYAHSKWWAR